MANVTEITETLLLWLVKRNFKTLLVQHGTKYSRVDQVKFVENSL